MSKKDFIALADAIKSHNQHVAHCNNAQCHCENFSLSQMDVLATFCKSQNSNFMKDRWMDYIAGECAENEQAAVDHIFKHVRIDRRYRFLGEHGFVLPTPSASDYLLFNGGKA